MKRVAVRKARAIHDMCAWIVPSLEAVGPDQIYGVTIHNGRGLPGDFRVTSKVVDPPVTLFHVPPQTGHDTWVAELRNVQAHPVGATCVLGPASIAPPLRFEISQIDLKYYLDRNWRSSTTRYPVDFL